MESCADQSRVSCMQILTTGRRWKSESSRAWAALEILAWQWLTRVDNLDPNKVDSRNADWRIRRMLKSMEVPIHIRPSMAVLLDFAAVATLEDNRRPSQSRSTSQGRRGHS